jgi:hypothetical protein
VFGVGDVYVERKVHSLQNQSETQVRMNSKPKF